MIPVPVVCADFDQRKELVVKAGVLLLKKGLVERTWGNVSIRLNSDLFAITPSGASYTELKTSDVVCVDIASLAFVGDRAPSSESNLHAEIYNAYSGVNFILHTHQKWASLLSLFCGGRRGVVPVPDEYCDVFGKLLPCAEYTNAGTKELAENVVSAFNDVLAERSIVSSGVVLMASHGVVVFGHDFDESFTIAETLELMAKSIIEKRIHDLGFSLGSSLKNRIEVYPSLNNFPTFSSDLEEKLSHYLLDGNFSLFKDKYSDFRLVFFKSNFLVNLAHFSLCENNEILNGRLIDGNYVRGIFSYFDDVAQIAGSFFKLIGGIDDIKIENINFDYGKVVIIGNEGILCLASVDDSPSCIVNLIEKNIYAFILSLFDKKIKPLHLDIASCLHESYVKAYSLLNKNK